jgi:hypothetical protein
MGVEHFTEKLLLLDCIIIVLLLLLYELLGFNAVQFGRNSSTFQRQVLSQSSASKTRSNNELAFGGVTTQKLIIFLKNAVFWDVTPCGSCKNRRFGGTYYLHHYGEKNQRARNVSGS